MVSFTDLGVPDDLIDALRFHGIDAPFPIQDATIPPALDGRDVSGRAPTGSGKTLAFGIPLVANVERARPKRPRALVLVPTRELAAQVSRDLEWLGAGRDLRVHAFYGGTKFEPQVKALRRGVDIAVACPGRLADLVNQGIVRLDGVDLVVVDEADRMADMGFLPEVRRLVDQTHDGRQTLLFSATLDGDVDALVKRYQHDPVTVDVTPEVDEAKLVHYFWTVPHAQRVPVTAAIIERVGPTVVFTRTRYGADRVARQLAREGIEAAAIHGARSQNQRDRALQAFRTGHAQALVATDVAARGIHVDDVTCVVHFDLPTDPKDYVHRSGRTGRAGATGVVVALAMPDRRKDTKKLLRELKLGVSVTDPDVESLPEGAPRPVKKARGRDHQGGPGHGHAKKSSGTYGARHKPSGGRPKRRFDSPDETKPAQRKGAGSGRSKSGSYRSGPKPGRNTANRRDDDRGYGDDRYRADGTDRRRGAGPRPSGQGSRGSTSRGRAARGSWDDGPVGDSNGPRRSRAGGPGSRGAKSGGYKSGGHKGGGAKSGGYKSGSSKPTGTRPGGPKSEKSKAGGSGQKRQRPAGPGSKPRGAQSRTAKPGNRGKVGGDKRRRDASGNRRPS